MMSPILLFALALQSLFSLITLFVFAAFVAFYFWMMVDAARQDRFWWLTCMVGVPIVGVVLYYLINKREEAVPPHTDHLGRKVTRAKRK